MDQNKDLLKGDGTIIPKTFSIDWFCGVVYYSSMGRLVRLFPITLGTPIEDEGFDGRRA